MFEAINRHAKRKLYDLLCRSVLKTPPLRTAHDGVVLFSMIGTRVLIPYLVAVKSLHHHLRRGRVVVLDDGSLTRSDKAVLKHHLDNPEILSIDDVDVGPCPQGGTWERLLTILDKRQDDYIIQLDSDTVTFGPVTEVEDTIAANQSFTLLGSNSDNIAAIYPVEEFTRLYFPNGTAHIDPATAHVQTVIEAVIATLKIQHNAHPKYVRGCSGFTGFARGGDRRNAVAFSNAAQVALGRDKWAQWGSEQVTSNFIIANDPGARILPPQEYNNYWGSAYPALSRMVHFIGTYRYHKWAYIAASRRAIAQLG